MRSKAVELKIHGTHILVQLRELEALNLPICAREPLGILNNEIEFNNLMSSSSFSLHRRFLPHLNKMRITKKDPLL